jgi:esterase
MKLFYRKYGEGEPLLILHGLFGQSDNWNTLAKKVSENGYAVYAVDLRNHGLSPHSEVWNYEVMTDDVSELVEELNLSAVNLLGHSMGGRVAMEYAFRDHNKLKKLIVADMAPKQYPPHHEAVLQGLRSIDFSVVKTRKAAEEQLALFVKEQAIRQFLLKNLYWKEEDELDWRFNLKVIDEKYEVVGLPFETKKEQSLVPTWFYKGAYSDYILESDWPLIKKLFPAAELITIPRSGHWIHAEQPDLFLEALLKTLKR